VACQFLPKPFFISNPCQSLQNAIPYIGWLVKSAPRKDYRQEGFGIAVRPSCRVSERILSSHVLCRIIFRLERASPCAEADDNHHGQHEDLDSSQKVAQPDTPSSGHCMNETRKCCNRHGYTPDSCIVLGAIQSCSLEAPNAKYQAIPSHISEYDVCCTE